MAKGRWILSPLRLPIPPDTVNLFFCGSRGSNSPKADYESAAFTRLLDPQKTGFRPSCLGPGNVFFARSGSWLTVSY